MLFLYLRQSSLWPLSIKTCQSVTLWRCHQSRWWTAVRSGWCKQTFPSLQQSDRVNRPCTIHTPLTGKVQAYTTACKDTPKVFFSPLTHPSPVSTAALRISPCHSRQPSVISDASAADGDRSSTPSDINSPRHRTHSLCNVRAAWHPRPSKQPSQLAFISTFTLLKYSVPALLISMASGARFVLMLVHADQSKETVCTCKNYSCSTKLNWMCLFCTFGLQRQLFLWLFIYNYSIYIKNIELVN